LKSDAARIKNVIRVMLEAAAFCRKERGWVINYIRDKWAVEQKTAETVYDQWLGILTPDGKIAIKDMQEYFDLAYAQKTDCRTDQCRRSHRLHLDRSSVGRKIVVRSP
jgi:hypothetical protein